MKLGKILFIIVGCLLLSACSNDIVRERVIEIDTKYDKLCMQGPVIVGEQLEEEICTTDDEVIKEFKKIINGIDAKKFLYASDLMEFTKETDQNGSYLFSLFQQNKPNGTKYYVTAYANGIFQFPELNTNEMRYVSKEEHLDRFEQIQQFVKKYNVK